MYSSFYLLYSVGHCSPNLDNCINANYTDDQALLVNIFDHVKYLQERLEQTAVK